jgi:hypothetical protein
MRPNPYIGPRSFRTGERLYGRDRELRRLLDLLIAERIVLLHAPSGAGKTSLVQAALIPALRAEGFAVLPPIRVSTEPPSKGTGNTGQGTGEEALLLSRLLGIEAPGAAPVPSPIRCPLVEPLHPQRPALAGGRAAGRAAVPGRAAERHDPG